MRVDRAGIPPASDSSAGVTAIAGHKETPRPARRGRPALYMTPPRYERDVTRTGAGDGDVADQDRGRYQLKTTDRSFNRSEA